MKDAALVLLAWSIVMFCIGYYAGWSKARIEHG